MGLNNYVLYKCLNRAIQVPYLLKQQLKTVSLTPYFAVEEDKKTGEKHVITCLI